MKLTHRGALALPVLWCLSLAGPALAQDDEKPESFTYATYHVCDLDRQDRADAIFQQVDKGVLDQAVTDGTITAYGYNAHHTGGRWRRVQYFMAPSIEALLAAQKKIGDAAEAKNKKLGDEYADICNAHDDYIWRRMTGTIGSVSPGGVAFSTYFVCDSRETRADELFKQLYAPVLDKAVADGKLKSWGWLEHIVGGQFRRLATMGATDMNALMAVRGDIIAALDGNDLSDQFTEICDTHTDYMWEVRSSKP